MKRFVQVLILSATTGFLVGGIWGTLLLQQEYQPQWLLPPESEISKWFYVKESYFPTSGEPGFIMIKQIDIAKEFNKIDHLVTSMSAQEQYINSISPWHIAFKTYVNKIKKINKPFEELISDETYFKEKFTQFLYSPRGGIFQPNFWFAGDGLKCGEPAPDILLQALPYSHKRYVTSIMKERSSLLQSSKYFQI